MVEQAKSPNSGLHTHRLWSRRKQIIMQFAVASVIFISGIVVGAGGTILIMRDKVRLMRPHRRGVTNIAQKMSSQYGLSEEQTKQVESLFLKQMPFREKVRKEMNQKLEAERQQFLDGMKKILSPQQYDQWQSDFGNRMKRFRGRPKRRQPKPAK